MVEEGVKFCNDQIIFMAYHIYLTIKWGFPLSRMTTNTKSVLRNFAIIQILPFLNSPKDLDLSYKMDLVFWGLFWKEKTLSCDQRNMVLKLCLE